MEDNAGRGLFFDGKKMDMAVSGDTAFLNEENVSQGYEPWLSGSEKF